MAHCRNLIEALSFIETDDWFAADKGCKCMEKYADDPKQIKSKDKDGYSILELSMENTKILDFMLPKLLAHNVDIFRTINEKFLIDDIHSECSGCSKYFKIFIKHCGEKFILNRDKYGRTPLHIAIEFRCFKCTKKLLDSGADISIENIDGDTPLSLILKDSPPFASDIFKYILDNAERFNFDIERLIKNSTILHILASQLNTKIIWMLPNEYILKYINKIDNSDNSTPLIAAVRAFEILSYNFKLPCIEYLLKCGADINLKDGHNKRAIDYAINENLKELLLNWQGLPPF